MPSFGPPCIHEAHFRHRGAPVSVSLRPSATVATWQTGPAAPIRGKASISSVFISTGSGVAIRRDLPGFAFACVHPCPKNSPTQMFLPIFRRQPALASVLHFVRTWICYSAVYAFACHRPSIHHRRSGSRLVILTSPKLQQEAATAPDISVTVAARPAPRRFSSRSPPSHQR